MVYNSKLVLAIKNNGKIVKEHGDKVYLPFGSEYSLLIKNLNTLRAIVNITIDGVDVCPGGLMVDANQSVDLERFVKNKDHGNKFKFIERSDEVEKHKGIGIEDGLIRVEYQFEMKPITFPIVYPSIPMTPKPDYDKSYQWADESYPWKITNQVNVSGIKTYGGILRNAPTVVGSSAMYSNTNSTSADAPVNDAGITVPGSISNQKFVEVEDFPLEDEQHVIVMKILGHNEGNEPIKKVRPARKKQKCTSCGKVNKANAIYCSHCGTALDIIE